MTDQTDYEFTADGVEKGFGGNRLLGLFDEADVTPDEMAGYLNEVFNQDARRAIANTKDDVVVPIEMGEIRIRCTVSFDEWKTRIGYDE